MTEHLPSQAAPSITPTRASQVAARAAQRPALDVQASGSRGLDQQQGGLATLARLFMAPRLRFELTYLPPLTRVDGEDGQAFADRVQQAIADHLGIPATTHTVEAKRAYRERLRQERRAA